MMEWLKKLTQRQGPDELAQLMRRGMVGQPVQVEQTEGWKVELNGVDVSQHVSNVTIPQLRVPSVIDVMPVFIPPQEARR